MRNTACIVLLFAALFTGSCKELNPPHPKPYEVVWVHVGTWSGHGSTQTDSFDMQIPNFRVKWKTSNGKGHFFLTVNSAISGRPLAELVDIDGPGEGIAPVSDEPRLYHLVIEAGDIDWTVTVEQPIARGVPDH